VLTVRQEKTHGKVCVCRAPMQKRTVNIFLAVRFFHRASLKKRTAKHLFAVRPKKYARQTFKHTENMEFPVVWIPSVDRRPIYFLAKRSARKLVGI
jgi:hypothetical protein